jgi:hypothetical protein
LGTGDVSANEMNDLYALFIKNSPNFNSFMIRKVHSSPLSEARTAYCTSGCGSALDRAHLLPLPLNSVVGFPRFF